MSDEADTSRDDPGLDGIDLAEGPRLPSHFYFHVPFCRSKCSYCDFFSVTGAEPTDAFAVFAGMESEALHWAMSALPGVVETVYVGGGTPSLHPAPVSHLLEHVRRHLPVREGAEVTVEANPESLTPSALDALLEAGATRVSVGVQAFDDSVLRLLGRVHDSGMARAACAAVTTSGADLSVDLICGVPGQTMTSWAETLEQAIDAGARHVSVYPLAIEEGTPLAVAISGGLVAEPDADTAADMMLLAAERLQREGIERYEVANYAVPGHESRHNTAYWTGRSYAGIGPGAHGMLDAQTARAAGLLFDEDGSQAVARVRYACVPDIGAWLLGAPSEIELLDAADAAREDVMLGMRLVRGVAAHDIQAAGVAGVLEKLAAEGLVELVGDRWRTTSRGWLLGNEVFGRIWDPS